MGEKAYFLLGYAKAGLDNIGDATLADLRRTSSGFLALSEDELEEAKTEGLIREIER